MLRTLAPTVLLLLVMSGRALAEQGAAAAEGRYAEVIRPLLVRYCWDCHADGGAEGMRSFDTYPSEADLLADRGLWWAVLKNVRAGVMPPSDSPRPTPGEVEQLTSWIKREAFGLDPADPDPGRPTLRRLNREEYRNTIRDLMGVDFDTSVEFPPDDSGSGFDNVGDALTLSPLLMEKYLQAAEEIVTRAVPRVSREMPYEEYGGEGWRSRDGDRRGSELDFYSAVEVMRRVPVPHAAQYRVRVDLNVEGGFNFDPGRCRVRCRIDDQELWTREFEWQESRSHRLTETIQLPAGERAIHFHIEPLTPVDQKKDGIRLRIRQVRVEGPLERELWEAPRGYDRFFTRRDPPVAQDEAGRVEYTRELISRFGLRAFRRPVDALTLDKLVAFARSIDHAPDRSFEDSIAQTMAAMLASPRFLFRFEGVESARAEERFPQIDEFALASRLSYFLWSTMPDQTLLDLASRGELRQQFDHQLARMLADDRSRRLIENFVGQWLQTRDVEGASIDPLAALGVRAEYDELRDRFFRDRRRRREPSPDDPPELVAARERITKLRELRDGFNEDLRRAMRRETELLFTHVMREDRSLLELIDCDYTFLNERLAKHYGIADVSGDEMRKVSLGPDSHRGGLLTQGTFLVVTSNPTRTSPVKRGLFILDNILGTPAPPAPAAVPKLEDAQASIADHEPTLREALELHRRDPLCQSCHARFDPLGLALENFNALGMWRDSEAGQPIDAAGQLITGEAFQSLAELKGILRDARRLDFYRCLTERMLTYALGRGLTADDEETLDQLVARLDEEGGRSSRLIEGIVKSAPFQRMRPVNSTTDAPTSRP